MCRSADGMRPSRRLSSAISKRCQLMTFIISVSGSCRSSRSVMARCSRLIAAERLCPPHKHAADRNYFVLAGALGRHRRAQCDLIFEITAQPILLPCKPQLTPKACALLFESSDAGGKVHGQKTSPAWYKLTAKCG